MVRRVFNCKGTVKRKPQGLFEVEILGGVVELEREELKAMLGADSVRKLRLGRRREVKWCVELIGHLNRWEMQSCVLTGSMK